MNCTHFFDGVCVESTDLPWYYSYKPSLIDGVSDHHLALAAPIIAYWLLSLFFHYLDSRDWKVLERYRIHPSTEVASRNQVSHAAVIQAVVFQHILQTVLGIFWMDDKPSMVANHAEMVSRIARLFALVVSSEQASRLAYFVYWWAIPLLQLLVAIFVIDTWQYFLHRYMHMNKFLYRHFHSWHHRLYVPFAFGALYNHPVEGFLLDSLGTVVAQSLSGMSTRQAAILFSLATFKTVDDHCGYRFPFDPLQMISKNNADYHDIHHQKIGIKSNFAQPFFIHWDHLLGTQMTRQDLELRRENVKGKTE
ncbi:sphingosine hydroxylase [Mycena pura]|uniref:Sphingosine hydroxylase n=1 Tax=Mycena pura TaxID=153505 RepID=A0AAD6YNF5_9AGAR|nr:sphingosine hydroxylase [Mycena pura]